MAQTINVDVTPSLFQPTLYYHQGDVGREFAINISTKDGYSIPSGATVKIEATKPSGFGFSVTGSLSNNVVTFVSTEGMTDEFGRFPAQLEITSGNTVIYTANFLMVGEKNTHPDSTVDGSQETVIPQLTLLVERVENAAAAVLDTTTEVTTLPAGSQATYSFDEETNTATFGIPQGEAGAGAAGVVASAYSASKTYAVGDYAIHNSTLYRCTTAITTAESFTASHWTQVVLADDVTDLKNDIDYIGEAEAYSEPTFLGDASAVYTGLTSDVNMYVSNRVIKAGSLIESVDIRSTTTGKLVLINEENEVVYVQDITEAYGDTLLHHKVNYRPTEDVRIGMVGFRIYFTQISSFDDTAISTDGLYEASNATNPQVGEVVTITKTSSDAYSFCIQWHIKEYRLVTTVNDAVYNFNDAVYNFDAPTKFTRLAELAKKGTKLANYNIMPFVRTFPNMYVTPWTGEFQHMNDYWVTEPLPMLERGKLTVSWTPTARIAYSYFDANMNIINGAYEDGLQTKTFDNSVASYIVLLFTSSEISADEVSLTYSFDNSGYSYVRDLLSSGTNVSEIDIDSFIPYEEGHYYDFELGTRMPNANWGNYIIPVSEGMKVEVKESSNGPFFAVQYKNGARVSGEVVYPTNNRATIRIGEADEIRLGIEIVNHIADGIRLIPNSSTSENTVYVGSGKDFETITSALQYSKSVPNLKIIVTKGTYDLVEELGGTEYINNNYMGTGLVIDNGVYILFEEGAKVLLNYTGTNENFMERFSPFTAHDESETQTNANYIIENLDLECSRVRYGIHDDMGHAPHVVSYTHKYINCHIKVDNTNNPVWKHNQCIGGGFGRYGYVEVDGGYFNSIPTSEVTANDTYEINYHANDEQTDRDQYSKIVIKNAYCEHSVEAIKHGVTTAKSKFFITNNSLARTPHKGETSSEALDNVEIIEWNNYIRS